MKPAMESTFCSVEMKAAMESTLHSVSRFTSIASLLGSDQMLLLGLVAFEVAGSAARLVAWLAEVPLEGLVGGTSSLLAMGGIQEWFGDFTAMLDGSGMGVRLAVILQSVLGGEVEVTDIAAEPSRVLSTLSNASSDLVDSIAVLIGPVVVLVKRSLQKGLFILLALTLAVALCLLHFPLSTSGGSKLKFFVGELEITPDGLGQRKMGATR